METLLKIFILLGGVGCILFTIDVLRGKWPLTLRWSEVTAYQYMYCITTPILFVIGMIGLGLLGS